MLLRRIFTLAALVVGLGASSLEAQSSRSTPLSGGLYLNLSPKGQKALSSEFHTILSQNGIAVEEIAIPEYVYESPEALTAEDFPPAFHESIAKLRKIFEEWLVGFEWSDPRPRLQAGPILVNHKGLEINLRVIPSQQRDEVRLRLDVQLHKLRVVVERIRLSDLNNDFLGEMGADQYTLSSGANSQPLKLSLIVSTQIHQGRLAWKLESMKSNLQDLDLIASFQRPLILPEVELRVGTRSHKLNTTTLEAKLLAVHPSIIEKAKVFASKYMEDELIEKLDSMPRESIDLSQLGETNTFSPPGAPKGLPQRQFFHWRLVPDGVSSLASNLRVAFAVDLWDPVALHSPPIDPSSMAREAPSFSDRDADVDLDLILNQGFLNRVVQLSFARKYFEKHELEPGEIIRFKSPPKLWIPRNSGVRDMELLLDFEAPLKGLQKFLVGSAVHIKVPVKTRFEKGPEGFQLKMLRLDVDRLWINPNNGIRFKGQVEKAVREKFAKLNADWKAKPSVLIDSMPVPDAFMGLGLKVRDIRTDPAGYVHF
jgi:hypothetical protein